MPVHFRLLGVGALGVVVAGVLRLCCDVGLKFCHERLLPLHAGRQLLRALLFLLVQNAVVLPHRLRLLFLLLPGLLVLAPLLLLVFLEHRAHGRLRLRLLLLELALLALHFSHDLLHQRRLLVLFSLKLFSLEPIFKSKLLVAILLFFHELHLHLLRPALFCRLPSLELKLRVLVIPLLLLVQLSLSILLLVHLLVQVHPQLPLKRVHAHLLAHRVLLVQIRCVLVQPRPVERLGTIRRLDHRVAQRDKTAAPLCGAAVSRDFRRGGLSRLVVQAFLEATQVRLGDIGRLGEVVDLSPDVRRRYRHLVSTLGPRAGAETGFEFLC
mmetsp:Transcript_26860/g.74999  ORF Transcript_26860/g.74999 Transcript_26860/m.74999 type:complete len:325 (-) Transcript_26860:248-1222(-)